MGKSIQLKDSEGNVYPKSKPYTIVSNNYGNAYKFDDGLMIAQMRYTLNTTVSNGWGNGYISGTISLPDYPLSFKSLPTLSVYAEGSDGTMIMNDIGNESVSKPNNIRLVRAASLTSSKKFTINIIAIGIWK